MPKFIPQRPKTTPFQIYCSSYNVCLQQTTQYDNDSFVRLSSKGFIVPEIAGCERKCFISPVHKSTTSPTQQACITMKFKRLARVARLFQEKKKEDSIHVDLESLSVATESGGSIAITLKGDHEEDTATSDSSHLSKITEASATQQALLAVTDTNKYQEIGAEKDDLSVTEEDMEATQIRDGGVEVNMNGLPGSDKHQKREAVESELSIVGFARARTSINVENTGDVELHMLLEGTSKEEESIVSSGGFDVIVNAMKAHSQLSAIQEFGCRTLQNLSNTEENRDAIVAAGAIDAVLCAMKEDRDIAEIQESAYGALENLTLDSDNAYVIGSTKGGVQIILDGMKHYLKHNLNIQTRGCAVLQNLSSHPDSLPAIVSADTISTILSTMQEHLEISEIQESGCYCLFNMLANTKDCAVTFTGGVAITLTAMKEHLTNANVQKAGTGILQHLSTDAINANMIASTGGIGILLSAMEKHQGISAIQDAGCRTLGNMLEQDCGAEENRNAIVAAGGIRGVLNAMKEHGDVAAVQESGCAALMYLSCNTSSSENFKAFTSATNSIPP